MKLRDAVLFLGSATAALLVSLLMLRWLAPELIGAAVPRDLELVQVDRRVPPFYEHVFSVPEAERDSFLLRDPVVVNRGNPLMRSEGRVGPHDMLGFRNPNVPVLADVIVLGDSQTYGNNAPQLLSWPGQVQETLGAGDYRVYTMALGSWGPLQYIYILKKAARFAPQVIVVAFYTGNDPLDAFRVAYSSEQFARYRVDPDLRAADARAPKFPPPASEHFPVAFSNGAQTVFTPTYRHYSSAPGPAADAGYRISWLVFEEMADELSRYAPIRRCCSR